jgi:hypothetical protein
MDAIAELAPEFGGKKGKKIPKGADVKQKEKGEGVFKDEKRFLGYLLF